MRHKGFPANRKESHKETVRAVFFRTVSAALTVFSYKPQDVKTMNDEFTLDILGVIRTIKIELNCEPILTNNNKQTVTNYLPNKRVLNAKKNQPANHTIIHLRGGWPT